MKFSSFIYHLFLFWLLLMILLLCTPSGAQSKPSATNDWLCIPGRRVGPITAASTEAELIKIFGKENVKPDSIDVGEGLKEPGTVIYPGTKNKLEILWVKDSLYRKIETILINSSGTHWHLPEGITIGSTLDEVVKQNGNQIDLYGLGWDYSGTVADYKEGKLQKYSRHLLLRLDIVSGNSSEDISGDKVFPSSAFKGLDMRVYEMGVSF